ncbi:MAG: bifunctional folylpolyglutamate synthase/dihydrofolate synthase [Bacteroidales bacterium]|nr:bifunctional folylpolyglutamate synthase/dihydrofolate synthase [Bacteroidales bacterium]
MNYTEAIEFLYSTAPMFQNIGKKAYKKDLHNTIYIDNYFGNPHKYYKTIHIAGTNGKGTVAHCLASILMEAGYNVGLYTSPHLKDFRERIIVNGHYIDKKFVEEFVNKTKNIIEEIKPSFFEITTIMAFEYFRIKNVDFAVIETGLGGRLDSTNIITPVLSVITNVNYDHTDILGETLQQIAYEKSGIIKPNIPVIIGESNPETDDIFIHKATQCNSEIFFSDRYYIIEKVDSTKYHEIFNVYDKERNVIIKNLKLTLKGHYQHKNISSILKAAELLSNYKIAKISEFNLIKGIQNVKKNTKLKGRWQIVKYKPYIVFDIAHNLPAFEEIVKQVNELKFNNKYFLLAFMKDKDYESIMKILPKNAYYIFTQPNIPRAEDCSILLNTAKKYKLIGESIKNPIDAYNKIKTLLKEDDFAFIGGSTYLVGELLP